MGKSKSYDYYTYDTDLTYKTKTQKHIYLDDPAMQNDEVVDGNSLQHSDDGNDGFFSNPNVLYPTIAIAVIILIVCIALSLYFYKRRVNKIQREIEMEVNDNSEQKQQEETPAETEIVTVQ